MFKNLPRVRHCNSLTLKLNYLSRFYCNLDLTALIQAKTCLNLDQYWILSICAEDTQCCILQTEHTIILPMVALSPPCAWEVSAYPHGLGPCQSSLTYGKLWKRTWLSLGKDGITCLGHPAIHQEKFNPVILTGQNWISVTRF